MQIRSQFASGFAQTKLGPLMRFSQAFFFLFLFFFFWLLFEKFELDWIQVD